MKRIFALTAATLVAGCSMAPNPKRPEPIIPLSWPQGDAYLRQSEATLPTVGYRDILRDPKLQAIIERALAGNQNLRVAIGNVAVARAEYGVAWSDIFRDRFEGQPLKGSALSFGSHTVRGEGAFAEHAAAARPPH